MKRLGTILGFCAVLAASPPVQAQSSTQKALKLFQSGFDKYNKGYHASALADFLRSHEIKPDFQTLFNIGKCYARLGRFDEAMGVFTRLVSECKVYGCTAAHLRQVRKERQRLMKLVGQITVHVNVPGAVVRVDGRVVETSPHKPIFLSAGKHHLDARAEGYSSTHKSIVVGATTTQQVKLVLRPARRTGRLRVECNQKGAEIKVDGRTVGKAPWEGELMAGEHVVQAAAGGYTSEERTIRVDLNSRTVSSFQLKRRPTRLQLTVTVNVPARIYLDGKLMGRGAVWSGQVETLSKKVGLHVEAADHLSWDGTVPVDPARPSVARVVLARSSRGPPPAWFWGTAGLSAALTIGAVTTGILTTVKRDEFTSLYRDDPAAVELAEKGNNLALATDVLIGAAIAGAVASYLLYRATTFGEHQSTGDLRFGVAPTGTGFALGIGGRY